MAEFNIRSDTVDVEQIMRQIRSRIREKRGIDYTEAEIRQLAGVKLETFLDPSGVRSDLLDQFRKGRSDSPPAPTLRNYGFEDDTLFTSHRGLVRAIRRLLRPILKLFFNPGPLADVLHRQSELNRTVHEDLCRLYEWNRNRESIYFEVMHNLVLEMTRLAIEVKNLKMRVESFSSRLDFDERRARALEGVVQYKPGASVAPLRPAGAGADQDESGDERKRRRRRRRRRSGRAGADTQEGTAEGPAAADVGDEQPDAETDPAGGADAPAAGPGDTPPTGPADDRDTQDQ